MNEMVKPQVLQFVESDQHSTSLLYIHLHMNWKTKKNIQMFSYCQNNKRKPQRAYKYSESVSPLSESKLPPSLPTACPNASVFSLARGKHGFPSAAVANAASEDIAPCVPPLCWWAASPGTAWHSANTAQQPGRDGQVATVQDSRKAGITNFAVLDCAVLLPRPYLQERSRVRSEVGDTKHGTSWILRSTHRKDSKVQEKYQQQN